MRRLVWLGIGAIAVIGSVFLVACDSGDDSPEDQAQGVATSVGNVQGAESEFCGDLAALGAAVTKARTLTSTSSVDDAEQARDDVKDAMDDVKSSAKNVRDVKLDELNDAHDELNSAVDDLEGDQTIGSAVATLQSEANSIALAQTAIVRQQGCP